MESVSRWVRISGRVGHWTGWRPAAWFRLGQDVTIVIKDSEFLWRLTCSSVVCNSCFALHDRFHKALVVDFLDLGVLYPRQRAFWTPAGAVSNP